MLWGDYADTGALKNLRMSLSNLKKLFANAGLEDVLEISRTQVALKPGKQLHCDVVNFLALTELEDEKATLTDAIRSRLEEAVALYRGEFLAGLSLQDSDEFSYWQSVQRELLHERINRTLELLMADGWARGDDERVLRYANRQLALSPWQEAAHRALMRALARSGRRAEALAHYDVCSRVLWEELGVEPSAETQTLRDDIEANVESVTVPNSAEKATPEIHHNLPSALPTFFGRSAERLRIAQLLHNDDWPLITLVGEGGIGKTHLALAIGSDMLPHLPDGAWFVPLARLAIGEKESLKSAMLEAIAMALNIDISGSANPSNELSAWLKNRKLLLILDNLEHLLDDADCAALIQTLLEGAPGLNVLATSRRPLRLRSEHVERLGGLPVPDSAESAAGRSCVQLFIERAERASEYKYVDADLPSIVSISRFVDGSPLALELAAGWTHHMSVSAIASTLQNDLGTLQTTYTDMPERHRSLEAVFDYSWTLLTASEQRMLASLSVFHGSFTPDAAQVVADADGAMLASLADKSLMRVSIESADERRYSLPVVVRHYAGQRLDKKKTLKAEALTHHCSYFMQTLIENADALQFNREPELGRLLARESGNFNQAWQQSIAEENWEALAEGLLPLFHLYDTRSRYREGEQPFAHLCEALAKAKSAEKQTLRGRAMARRGWFLFQLGDTKKGRELIQQGLTLLEKTNAIAETIFCYNYLGASAMHIGDYEAAEQLVTIAQERAIAHDDRIGQMIALNLLGRIAWFNIDATAATKHCRASLAIARQLEHPWSSSFSLEYLGQIAFARQRFAEAQRLYQESLTLREQLGDLRGSSRCHNWLGDTAYSLGQPDEAERLFNLALETFEQIGNLPGVLESNNRLGELALAGEQTPEARTHFMAVLNLARTMQMNPPLLTALVGMAQVYAQEGSDTEGLSLWAWLRKQDEVSGTLREQVEAAWVRESAEISEAELAEISETWDGQTAAEIAASIW